MLAICTVPKVASTVSAAGNKLPRHRKTD